MLLHGITYGGHPVAAALALRNIEIFEREGVLENVRAHEGYLGDRLRELQERLPIVGDVRGAGYFWALELVRDEAGTRLQRRRARAAAARLPHRAPARGGPDRPPGRPRRRRAAPRPAADQRRARARRDGREDRGGPRRRLGPLLRRGVKHDAHGWWLAEAGPVAPAAPLRGDQRADVVVIGGGYAGLWTAWQLLERGASVALLEADVCGHGPSGRNGGFARRCGATCPTSSSASAPSARSPPRAPPRRASPRSARGARREGVDAWFRPKRLPARLDRRGPGRRASRRSPTRPARPACTASRSSRSTARARAPAAPRRCSAAASSSPDDATVHPARLALGLRERVIARGARVFEHSRVRALRAGADVVAETEGGSVRAGAAVARDQRRHARLRARCATGSPSPPRTSCSPSPCPTRSSSSAGPAGRASPTRARSCTTSAPRTTAGSCSAGAAGSSRPGARLHGRVEVDPDVAAETRRHLDAMLPAVAGRAITHAWGGPIDVSPSHLPQVGTLDGAPVHYAFGFTGNGVGPSHLAGRILAARAAGETPGGRAPGRRPAARPARAVRLGRRDGRPRRLPAQGAHRGGGAARRPAHPRGLRGAEGARHPRLALTAWYAPPRTWRASASPSFFSSPLGGNSAWRPRSREPS